MCIHLHLQPPPLNLHLAQVCLHTSFKHCLLYLFLHVFVLFIKWGCPLGMSWPLHGGLLFPFPSLPAFIDGRVVAGFPPKKAI